MYKPKVHHTHTHTHTENGAWGMHSHALHITPRYKSERTHSVKIGITGKATFFLSFFNSCWISHAFWSRVENQRDEHQSRKSKTLCQSWQPSHQLTTASGRAEKCNALSQITDGTNVCADCRALKCYRTNNASGKGHVTSFQFHQEVKWEELFPCQMEQTC